MTWNQPICRTCANKRDPGRNWCQLRDADTERCAWCGQQTRSGIYIRHDPADVPFPTEES